MRYFFPDPDNSERLIKTPLHTVEQIRADALRDAVEAVRALGHDNCRDEDQPQCDWCAIEPDVVAVLESLGEQQ